MERLYLGSDIEAVSVAAALDDDVTDANGSAVGPPPTTTKCRIFFRDIKKRRSL